MKMIKYISIYVPVTFFHQMILIHLGFELRLEIHIVLYKLRAHFWFDWVTYVAASRRQMYHITGRQRA